MSLYLYLKKKKFWCSFSQHCTWHLATLPCIPSLFLSTQLLMNLSYEYSWDEVTKANKTESETWSLDVGLVEVYKVAEWLQTATKTHNSYTYQYCCIPLHFLKSKHYNENNEKALPQMSFAGWKEERVVNQGTERWGTTVQSRAWSQLWKRQPCIWSHDLMDWLQHRYSFHSCFWSHDLLWPISLHITHTCFWSHELLGPVSVHVTHPCFWFHDPLGPISIYITHPYFWFCDLLWAISL